VRRTGEWVSRSTPAHRRSFLQRRLTGLDLINQGMLFAATLLLCALPFLIVVTALPGKSSAAAIGRRMGLDRPRPFSSSVCLSVGHSGGRRRHHVDGVPAVVAASGEG
jgi:hypothetical protein